MFLSLRPFVREYVISFEYIKRGIKVNKKINLSIHLLLNSEVEGGAIALRARQPQAARTLVRHPAGAVAVGH